MASDGITVEPFPNAQTPYANDCKFHSRFIFAFTKIMVFSMIKYLKMFTDADAFVV